MQFSIEEQTVPLPGGGALVFAVDPVDSSICTLATNGHTLTFKRNGALLSVVEDKPADAPAPLSEFKSVDDEPVRTTKLLHDAPVLSPGQRFRETPPAPKPTAADVEAKKQQDLANPPPKAADKVNTSTSLDGPGAA